MKKIICILLTLALVASVIFTPSSAVSAKTYKRDVTYKFKGKIEKVSRQQWNGSWITAYCIKLKKPIKVKAYWGKKIKVKRMDVFTSNKKLMKKVKKKLNKKVTIKGKIYEPGTSHYINDFVLDPRKVK